MLLKILFMFAAAFALDFVWARHTIACANRKALQASSLSVLLLLIGAGEAILYVGDHWMLVPAAAGAFLGTYVSVR